MYEYRCDDCERTFVVSKSISEHDQTRGAPECPECGGSNTHQLFSSFFAKTSSKT